jgi:hypothetical protein
MQMTHLIPAVVLVLTTIFCQQAGVVAFLPLSFRSKTFPSQHSIAFSKCSIIGHWRRACPPLLSGRGVATNYTWEEEAFEIEVTVNVPKGTFAKDIHFKASPSNIDLRLTQQTESGQEEIVLMDKTRKLKGRVLMDGTYWEISDAEDFNNEYRQVTVTIEKNIRAPKDDFDVVEFDWKGVYSLEDEGEVSERTYDVAEVLDTRAYAASLGVDIDNIDMSLVDKTMFTSGLNLTNSALDGLTEAGYLKEVTQQGDGSEWVTGEEGEAVPYSSFGDGVSKEEVQESRAKIPFLDTASPWNNAVPVDEKEESMANTTDASTSDAVDTKKVATDSAKMKELIKKRKEQAADPIEALPVARLKEILRSKGLTVSGTKKELQDRLRGEVQGMLTDQKKTNDNPTS